MTETGKGRKKIVQWSSVENELLMELFLDSYDSYYFRFADGSKKSTRAVRESLHEKWAEQLSRLGNAERTPTQVHEKIKKNIAKVKKYIKGGAGFVALGYRLPPFLRPLELKLREEHDRQRFDADGSIMKSLDFTGEQRDGSPEQKFTRVSPQPEGNLELDDECAEQTYLNSTLPSLTTLKKRRAVEEDPEDLSEKRQRLLDAKLELVARKKYLTDLKVKYWEKKMKRLEKSGSSK
ncbi:unnamed protein product [Nippostrongylus brasiliensis]|uniref:Regulatory protein zeste n=1 Tax=Nippostrongylus brasiliensis TaxID=27835 RepID=A0A158QWV6_NIPBR|nr:unnamed protein product [Nippostrongylus brasiliensis]